MKGNVVDTRVTDRDAYARSRGWKVAARYPSKCPIEVIGQRAIINRTRHEDYPYPMDHTQLFRDYERYIAFITEPYGWDDAEAGRVRQHMLTHMTGLVLELPEHPGWWCPPHTTLVIYTIDKTLFDGKHTHDVVGTESDLRAMGEFCYRNKIRARLLRNMSKVEKSVAAYQLQNGRNYTQPMKPLQVSAQAHRVLLATEQDAVLWNLGAPPGLKAVRLR